MVITTAVFLGLMLIGAFITTGFLVYSGIGDLGTYQNYGRRSRVVMIRGFTTGLSLMVTGMVGLIILGISHHQLLTVIVTLIAAEITAPTLHWAISTWWLKRPGPSPTQ